jgi:Ca2+-binding RTX toxin-like protein
LTVTLSRAGGANADDHFTAGSGVSFVKDAILVRGVNIGTVTESAGTLKLAFNTAATPALVDAALQGIAYQNTGNFVNTQVVTINWDFSTHDGSAASSTDIALLKTDAPYWIDAMLDRDFPGQTASAISASLRAFLGEEQIVNLQFAADGSAPPFSSAAQTTILRGLDQLSSLIGLQTGSGGTKVVAHYGSELAAGESAFGELTKLHGDLYLSSSPTQASVLQSLGHLLGAQNTGLPAADAAANSAPELGVLDIAALQYLYGPSKTARSGDDTYHLSADTTNFIWDGAGKDTISAAGLTADVTLHLEPGQWDYIGAKGSTITAAGQVTINYGSSIENITGGSGNDKLTGSSEANLLAGGAGNDVLTGMSGNDTLDGGAGIDTAVYVGKGSNYAITRTATGWSVKDTRGLDGSDQVSGIERLQFSDKFVALGDDAAQVYRLYQAAFGRTPDAGGFGYWLHAQDAGASLREIAGGFVNSAEFKTLYSGASEEAFVTQLYQNVLHRAPDAAGLTYWADHLKTDATRLDVLLGFSESAENIAALVAMTDAGMTYVPFG